MIGTAISYLTTKLGGGGGYNGKEPNFSGRQLIPRIVHAVLLDLSKASDSISHQKLQKNCSIGFSLNSISLMQNSY